MTTTFLLIRHAAHVHLDVRLSGRMPGIGLSDDGRAQAVRLGSALAGEPIDRILCSPLDRTRDTAAAIAAPRGMAIEPVDALVEIDMGDWTGHRLDAFDDDPAWRAWNEHRGTARIPGGETMREAQARIVDCLAALTTDTDGCTVAVVTHADMIRAAVTHVLGMPLDDLLRFDVAPASVTRLLWGAWGTRLMTLNEKVA